MQHKGNNKKSVLLNRIFLQQDLETERFKGYTVTDEMLAHGFNPVQTQGMQHGTCTFHDTQHGNGSSEPKVEDDNHNDRALNAGEGESVLHGHIPQDDGETLMGERQSPETEVRSSVGDAVEAEF